MTGNILGIAMTVWALSAVLSPAAHAFPAHRVLNDMSGEERFAYLAGYIEMGHFLLENTGQREMGECLIGWFYTDKKGYKDILHNVRLYPDIETSALVWALMKKFCGPKSKENSGLVERDAPSGIEFAPFTYAGIEMARQLAWVYGQKERSKCITKWGLGKKSRENWIIIKSALLENRKKNEQRDRFNAKLRNLMSDPEYAEEYRRTLKKLLHTYEDAMRTRRMLRSKKRELDQVLADMRARAAILAERGMRVYRRADGFWMTERGKAVSPGDTVKIVGRDKAPSWEEYKGVQNRRREIQKDLAKIARYEETMNSTKRRMGYKNNETYMEQQTLYALLREECGAL